MGVTHAIGLTALMLMDLAICALAMVLKRVVSAGVVEYLPLPSTTQLTGRAVTLSLLHIRFS